jgi:hypothetical protein
MLTQINKKIKEITAKLKQIRPVFLCTSANSATVRVQYLTMLPKN